MIKEIFPIKKINAKITIPGSKSITNRAFIIASLARGKSKIYHPLNSDDTKYLINALKSAGIKIKQYNNYIMVEGNGGEFDTCQNDIFIGNAGTTIRFITSVLTLGKGAYNINCDKRMSERPIDDLVGALISLGADIKYLNKNGYPPLKITGKKISGGEIIINGDKSSQFISSLLMIAPVLEKGLIIRINGDLVSKPYIDTTINIMQDFGINVQNDDYSIFTIKGGQKYKNKNYTVPGDASSASYFMAATATCGGKIKIKNVGSACNQGDIHFAYLLKQMGAEVKIKKYSTVIKSNGNLNGICVDLNNTPDIVQTLIATALFAKGETTITNVSNLRIKETDRLKALENELKKIGAEVETGNDWIKIMPSKNYKACEIETYDDHRMAMSFAITGLKINGIKIKDSEVVSKSFPNFWDLFDSLNI